MNYSYANAITYPHLSEPITSEICDLKKYRATGIQWAINSPM